VTGHDATSNEIASYVTISDNDVHYFTLGYSNLRQTAERWTWTQNFAAGGLLLSRYPYQAKLQYGHLWGDIDYEFYDIPGSHVADLYSGELLRHQRRFTLGAGYTQYHQFDTEARIARVYMLRFNTRIYRNIFASVKPVYTRTNDGRRLFASDIRLSRRLMKRLDIVAGGTLGERAFSYDNDLLVIDNQSGTQNGRGFVKAYFKLPGGIYLVGEYLHSYYRDDIGKYSVDYYIAGLSMRQRIQR
jgi:hypothetical protein